MFAHWLGITTLLPLALGNGPPDAATPAPQRSSILGKALFVGNAQDYTPRPVPEPLGKVCIERHRRDPIVNEDVVLNRDTDPVAIRNVIVSLKMLPAAEKPPSPPSAPVLVEMRGCVFQPHVVAVQAGQPLRFVNADDNMMAVHLRPAVNPEANYTRPHRGDQLDFQLKAEPPFRVKSDVFPWTSLWVAVLDHPFFAVTGDDGSFKIANVPQGRYTLEAWHETFGTLNADVDLTSSQTKTIDFTFAPERK